MDNSDSDDDHFMVDKTAASKKRRRLKLILVLDKEDSFSPRTRNKMDELVVEFLHKTRVDIHVSNDSDDDHFMDEQTAAAKKRRRLKLLSVIEKEDEFSLRTTNKMDEFVVEFLHKTRVDIHDMLCEDDLENNYNGLDDSRDTEAEVESAIRFFPEVLSRRKSRRWDEEQEQWFPGYYPIQYLAFIQNYGFVLVMICNVKAVSFIPLLARLAIELGLFEKEERGGLLFKGNGGSNVLLNLMLSDRKLYTREHHESVDEKFLQILVQLRKMGLLKKEDIQRYEMLHELCDQFYHFAEKRFRFLVEWDPSALLYPNVAIRAIPLHCAAHNYSLRGFQLVYEYGIRYYPKRKGINLIFKKEEDDEDDEDNETPFQAACKKFGYVQVMKIIEDTLIRYTSSDNTPINFAEALLIAAIDDNIHLDCVYFILRRHPDLLVTLLSPSTPAAASTSMAGSNNNSNEDDADDDEGGDGHSDALVTKKTLDYQETKERIIKKNQPCDIIR